MDTTRCNGLSTFGISDMTSRSLLEGLGSMFLIASMTSSDLIISSKYWGEFVGQLYYKRGPDGRVIMRERYYEFRKELQRNFTRKQVIRKC